jgi:type I restriction enzyme, S subunit
MKNCWQTRKIGDVCKLMTGGTPSKAKPEYFGGDIKWLVSGDIHQGEMFDCEGRITELGMSNSNAKPLPINSVMIALNGQGKTRGTVALLRTQATCNQSLVSIYPKEPEKLLPEFLYANLHGRYQEIRHMTGDSGNDRRGLNMNLIASIAIPIAPLPEQKRIVGILDKAFDGIATAKSDTEKNLQNARALFESHLESVFSRRGHGWVEKTLEEVCHQITDGKHGDCRDEADSGFYFLSAKDIKGGTLNYDGARQITKTDFEETHRRTNLEPGDILITNAGTIGRMAIAPLDGRTRRTTFQKSVAVLKPVTTEMDSKFAFYCLSSGLTRFVNLSAGAAQKNLLLRDLRSYRFPLPQSLDQQAEVARKLDDLSAETQRLESVYQKKLAALEAFKKSLLHQAFSGAL